MIETTAIRIDHRNLLENYGIVVPWLADSLIASQTYEIQLNIDVELASQYSSPVARVEATNGANSMTFALPLVNYSTAINSERLRQAAYLSLLKLGPVGVKVRVSLDEAQSGRKWGKLQSVLRKRIRGACLFEQWNIGILPNDVESSSAALLRTWDNQPVWMDDPKTSEFVADPFVIDHDGRAIVLYEHLDRSGIGRIRLRTFDGKYGVSKDVLTEATHLSYPYVVRHNDSVFVVPESSSQRNVRLYEFDAKKLEFGRFRIVLDSTPAVDSSICFHEGKWWMFCTIAGLLENGALFAFYADQIEGPYRPHAMNPIKVDFTGARPGGTMFHEPNGRLVRPGQVCWKSYGESLMLHEVLELTPEAFIESDFRNVLPDREGRFSRGLHTLSVDGTWAVVDCLRSVIDPFKLFR